MDERQRMREERERRWHDWMVAGQTGDAAAYEKLLFELLPRLRAFVARRLGDPEAREDVVQNVFISIHRARHTYRPERPFGPWLYAVARNAVTDHRRSQARRQRREVSLDPEEIPQPVVEEHSGPDATLSPELAGALDGLPDGQREAVMLIHLEGLSVAEAAARAGVSRSALKVRAHRGYRAMRILLGERR